MTTQKEVIKALIANGWTSDDHLHSYKIFYSHDKNMRALVAENYISIRRNYHHPALELQTIMDDPFIFGVVFSVLSVVGDTLIYGPMSFRLSN